MSKPKLDKRSMMLAKESVELADFMGAFLAGRDRAVQSAVIADLLAKYLAGHVGPDKIKVREEVLRGVLALVGQLVPVNEAQILERLPPEGRA